MLKPRKAFLLVICTVLILSSILLIIPQDSYANAVFIANGGFETGDFTGWNVSVPQYGMAQVVTRYNSVFSSATYTAREGNYFALLRPGIPDNYTTVSQNFYANKGSVISGWAFFRAEDYMPYDDASMVEILILNTVQRIVLTTVFSASVRTVGSFGGTDWTYWSYMLPGSGQFSIAARITNAYDPAYPSCIGLDGVSLLANPEKPFKDTDSSSAIPTQSWAKPADTKVLTASVQPDRVIAGQPVKIMANAANRGDVSGTLTATLSINGQIEESKQLNLSGNSGRPVEFTVTRDIPGTYTIDVNGQTAYFTVLAPKSQNSSKTLAYAIICIMSVLAALIGMALVLRRRYSR